MLNKLNSKERTSLALVKKPVWAQRGGFRKRDKSTLQEQEASREQRLADRAARAVAMARGNAARGQQQGGAPVFSGLVRSIEKAGHVEHEGYRRYVTANFACMFCGVEGRSQFAHANEGKGFALKTDDRTGFALCCAVPGDEGCHVRFDQYRLVEGGREAHRALEVMWGRQTRGRMLELGAWPKNLERWLSV